MYSKKVFEKDGFRVKVLTRNPDDYLRATKKDIHKTFRNYDPVLHPFQEERERVKALNAAKIENILAKPFLGALNGHRDGVQCIANHPTRLPFAISGSYDGEVRIWNLATQKNVGVVQAHDGIVQGIATHPSGSHFYTVGDQTIKQWRMPEDLDKKHTSLEETKTFLGDQNFLGISHHKDQNQFVTGGNELSLWDSNKSEPLRSMSWGYNNFHAVTFNQSDTHMVSACTSGNEIVMFDIRATDPMIKIKLAGRSNNVAWNPQEPSIFTAANEDYNLYTFDYRNLSSCLQMLSDHTAAVMDVSYSPTGRELVSGSYDRSIRIYNCRDGHSREVYALKRMQRVGCVQWSGDARFILSGSDEHNLRLWKAEAAAKFGILTPREKQSLKESKTLKEKFSHCPEVKRIIRHKHVPKHIKAAKNEHRIIKESRKRKEANRRAHSKPGEVPFTNARKAAIRSVTE